MTERQKYLQKLLMEVDEICREHNLRYVVAGETLIGTLRHEGFVPWDDEVHLYMPRQDWERFMEISRTELPPDRVILCSEADRSYTNSFPRYASKDTCALHKSQIIGKDCGGEGIDILTLDPVPDDDREYEKYRTYLMIYSDLINISTGYSDRWEIPASMYLKYLLSYIFLGKNRTLRNLERKMFSYREEDCNRYAMRWGGCPFLIEKDLIFPARDGVFEGKKVMIPNRCSAYLIRHYGDEWSYIPPHNRKEGSGAVRIDGISFQELREEYLPGIKKGKLRRNAVICKFYNMLIAGKSHKIRQEGLQMKARAVALDLLEAIKESGCQLQELMEHRAYRRLSNLFSPYYKVQLSPEFIGREDYRYIYSFYHPVLIEIPDDIFLAAVKTLFYTERISQAYRMLEIRGKQDHLTPGLKKLKQDIEHFRKAVGDYEFQHMEEAAQVCDELLKEYPNHPGFMKFKCRFLMEKAGENRLQAEHFLDRARKLFPEDGYFIKYKADILWMNGERIKALELYAQVKEKTSNGIVWLEMDRLFNAHKEEILQSCESMIEHQAKTEALQMMEAWNKILPEDEDIRAALYLARISSAHTRSEIENVISEIGKKIETSMQTPLKNEREQEKVPGTEMYKKAMTKAWKRLGYPAELAKLRTEAVCICEESELEWIAEQIRSRLIHKEERAYVYKLIGDIRQKQGQTKSAFENYQKALEYAEHGYMKTELYRIFINDLNNGSRKIAEIAKKSDVTVLLNNWLDKYGSLEEIQKIATEME